MQPSPSALITKPASVQLSMRIWLIAAGAFIAFLITTAFALAHQRYSWEATWHTLLANVPVPGWISLMAVIFTIGSTILGPAVFIWAGVLLTQRRWQRAAVWLATLIPSLITYEMKAVFLRACPANPVNTFAVLHITFLNTFYASEPHVLLVSCYPSGHTTTYISVFGLLAYITATAHPRMPWQSVALAGSLFLIATIGIAAIALDKHEGIDIIGAYFLGPVCLIILIWLYRLAIQRETVPARR